MIVSVETLGNINLGVSEPIHLGEENNLYKDNIEKANTDLGINANSSLKLKNEIQNNIPQRKGMHR